MILTTLIDMPICQTRDCQEIARCTAALQSKIWRETGGASHYTLAQLASQGGDGEANGA